MHDRLPCILTAVHANVKPGHGRVLLLDAASEDAKQVVGVDSFLLDHAKQIRRMPAGQHQEMALRHGKPILDSHD